MTNQKQVVRPRQNDGADLALVEASLSGRFTGVSLDSRYVQPGDLYVGLPGTTTHGARFAQAAAEAGAVAMVTDAAGATLVNDLSIPVVVVADPRQQMAALAAAAYGYPTRATDCFGVTGTNGKTSTVFLLEAALTALHRQVATIGTIGYRVNGAWLEAHRTTITTPESPELQALLAVMTERGAQAVAMEVSSHALALHRVDAVEFDVVGFTMFGQDHLDFHHTVADYFDAKAKLFTEGRARVAVINIEDEWGRKLAERVLADGRTQLVTTGGPASNADYRVVQASTRPDGGSDVIMHTPNGRLTFTVGMLGSFNVNNAVTALAMVGAAGFDVATAATGLATASVPGRMQRVELEGNAPHVVVDFAHTPQAVEAALQALPASGRHLVVFGAGGDRDATKRGPMGATAARCADVVIVTDDNPRRERPEDIRAAVMAGAMSVTNPRAQHIIDGGSRREAIAQALSLAKPGDWIAILGKGHEQGQEIDGVITPFDDVEVVCQAWMGTSR